MQLANMRLTAPVSAFAARKARQQQQQEETAHTVNKALELESQGEPPSKKARRLSEENAGSGPDESARERRTSRRNKNARGTADVTEKSTRASGTKGRIFEAAPVQDEEDQAPSDIESEIERASVMGENNDDTVASVNGDADGYAHRIPAHDIDYLLINANTAMNPPRRRSRLKSKTSLSPKRD